MRCIQSHVSVTIVDSMGKLSDTEVRIFRQLIVRRQNDEQKQIAEKQIFSRCWQPQRCIDPGNPDLAAEVKSDRVMARRKTDSGLLSRIIPWSLQIVQQRRNASSIS